MKNVSTETHMSLCERKISFTHAQESNHDLKCESNHYPCNCEPLSKIGRLSLIKIELKLFQEQESSVHKSDGYTMLMSNNKVAPGSRQL